MNAPLLLVLGCAAAGAFWSAPSAATATAPAPGTWKVDPVHTTVGFRIKHLNASWFHGRFNEASGTLVYDPENPAASSISLEIAAASVDTNHTDRDDHLRNADFFNAKVHPKISFKSSSVAAAGEGKLKVKGTLALHGVEKEIVVDAEFTGTGKAPWGELIGFETSFTIRRGEFGITAFPGALGEEVNLHIAIEAIKQ